MLAAAKRKERKEEQKKQQILAAQASAQRTGILLNRKAQQKAAARAAAAKAAEEAAQKAAIVSPDPTLQGQEAAWLAGKIEKDKKTKPKGAPKPPAPGVHAQTPPPNGIGTQNQEDMCLNPQAGQGINWGVISLPIIGPKQHTVIKATATPTLTATAAIPKCPQKVSQEAIDMVKEMEWFVKHPYNDGTGSMTIGYGYVPKNPLTGNSYSLEEWYAAFPNHIWNAGNRGMSEEEANIVLISILNENGSNICNNLTNPESTLNQYQYDSLSSFAYNLGGLDDVMYV